MEHHCHAITPCVPSVHQTLDEMDFERGLWYAAMTGDVERVSHLLSKGHSPDEQDRSGYVALHYAARAGHTQVCARLLDAGANVDTTTRAGKATALHRAALAGKDDTVRLLLKRGADPRLKDGDGKTAVQRAAEGGSPKIVDTILHACPDLAPPSV